MVGMHNPKSCSILEHALEIIEMARPLIEAIYRKDRDLGSQVRRALSSVALNLAEGFGCTGGSARARFETASGSLNEARTGFRIAVAWRYIPQSGTNELLESMHSLGGRVFGLCRR
jgi:four helix bundle protein